MVRCVVCWVGGLVVFRTVDNTQLMIPFHTVASLYLACSFSFHMADLVCTMINLVLYGRVCFVCWCLFGRMKHLCEVEIVFWVDETRLDGQFYRMVQTFYVSSGGLCISLRRWRSMMGSRGHQSLLSHLVVSRGRQSPLSDSVSPYSAVARSARYNVGRFNYSGRIRPSKRGFVHPADSFDSMQMFSSTDWISEYKMESTVKNGTHHYTNRSYCMK